MDGLRLILTLYANWQVWIATAILVVVYAVVRYLTRFDRRRIRGYRESASPLGGPIVTDEPTESSADNEEKLR